MYTRLAYLGVVAIWATTPLAIQWSGEGVGFRFGVTARMVLGVVATLVLLVVMRDRLPWHRAARNTYVAGGLGIYCAMSCIYWASQLIPSGWVSIVFGLSPLITGLLAAVILKEDALSPHKLLGIGLGFAGLLITFGESLNAGQNFVLGVAGVLLGTTCHCFSAVMVKRIGAQISGVSATAGSLLLAVPLYLLTWLATQSELPEAISPRAAASIIYLGVIGTAVGFALYYYVLKHLDVSKVSLITLITPVCALTLGYLFNGEQLSLSIVVGTTCVLAGLLCHEFGRPVMRLLVQRA